MMGEFARYQRAQNWHLALHNRQGPERTSTDTSYTRCLSVVVESVVSELGVPGAGVAITLRNHTLGAYTVAATAPWVRAAEVAQLTAGEGPSLTALSTGAPVLALRARTRNARWPGYAHTNPRPDTAMIALAMVIPGRISIGTFTLYVPPTAVVRPQTITAAVDFAGIAAVVLTEHMDEYLGNVGEGPPGDDAAIDIAAGVLSVRDGISPADASVTMRAEAFSSGKDLREIARSIIADL